MKRNITITIIILLITMSAKAQLTATTDCVQCGGESGRRGDYSSVLGYSNYASGTNAISAGLENSASGETSIAIGYSNTASGIKSIAIGYGSQSTYNNAVSIGYKNVSSGVSSVAIGMYAKVQSNHGLVIGKGYSETSPLLNTMSGIMFGFGSSRPTMFITNSGGETKTGKIAIGNTTTPQAKLHVLADSNENADLLLQSSGSGKTAAIMFQDSNNKISVNSSGNMTMNANSFSLTGGNVGIGCAANGGYALSVKGKVHAEEVVVELMNNWPDYVFSNDYNLPELDNIKKYIENNGHLPDFPSADVISNEGISLGEMNTLLLKKIEELILYIINQDERIKKLESELLK